MKKYKRLTFRADGGYGRWWWLRSPCSGDSSYFCSVGSGGGCNYYGAGYAGGVSPCFSI